MNQQNLLKKMSPGRIAFLDERRENPSLNSPLFSDDSPFSLDFLILLPPFITLFGIGLI